MAGWPDIAEDDEQLVAEIVTRTKSIRAAWIAWGASISSTTPGLISSQEARERYQEITAYRSFMVAKVTTNAAGITAAYLRRRPALGSLDAAARWGEQKATIDAFVTWFKTNWFHLATGGHPAFSRFKVGAPNVDELEDIPITLTAPQKTAILAQINAVLAAFTSS